MLGGCCCPGRKDALLAAQQQPVPELLLAPAQKKRPSSTALCELLTKLTLPSGADGVTSAQVGADEPVTPGRRAQVIVRLQLRDGGAELVPQFKPHPLLWPLVGRLREATTDATLELSRLHGAEFGLSGAQVLLLKTSRRDGVMLRTTVLKFDKAASLIEEARLTKEVGPRWGPAHPRVLDLQQPPPDSGDAGAGEPWALMQIELCGGSLGVAELAAGRGAVTLASQLVQHIKDGSAAVDIGRVLNSVGHHLTQFTGPQRQALNLFEEEKIRKRVLDRLLKNKAISGLQIALLPDGVSVGEHLSSFVQQCEAAPAASLLVATGSGMSHGDFHGGNVLLDADDTAWAIDFATVEDGAHGLTDLGKLMVWTLIKYLFMATADDGTGELSDGEADAFCALARRLAAVPSLCAVYPESGAGASAGRVGRVEQALRALWPSAERLSCGAGGGALVWVLLRYAGRTADADFGGEVNTPRKRELVAYLLAACTQRLQADVSGDRRACPWLEAAEGEWGHTVTLTPGVVAPQVEAWLHRAELRAYCSQVAQHEAWQLDPISCEKVHVREACIRVETQRLATGVVTGGASATDQPAAYDAHGQARSRRQSMGMVLSEMLRPIFPAGVPSRLLVVGGGGTGKVRASPCRHNHAAPVRLAHPEAVLIVALYRARNRAWCADSAHQANRP